MRNGNVWVMTDRFGWIYPFVWKMQLRQSNFVEARSPFHKPGCEIHQAFSPKVTESLWKRSASNFHTSRDFILSLLTSNRTLQPCFKVKFQIGYFSFFDYSGELLHGFSAALLQLRELSELGGLGEFYLLSVCRTPETGAIGNCLEVLKESYGNPIRIY